MMPFFLCSIIFSAMHGEIGILPSLGSQSNFVACFGFESDLCKLTNVRPQIYDLRPSAF